jgi:ElaB/YqjD/DUF883 family membrane-anchored ribosome-binding protein
MADRQSSAEELKELKDDLYALRKDVQGLVGALASDGGDQARRAGSAIKEKARQARDHAAEIGERAEHAASAAKDVLASHPFMLSVAALGAGLLAGALLWRR